MAGNIDVHNSKDNHNPGQLEKFAHLVDVQLDLEDKNNPYGRLKSARIILNGWTHNTFYRDAFETNIEDIAEKGINAQFQPFYSKYESVRLKVGIFKIGWDLGAAMQEPLSLFCIFNNSSPRLDWSYGLVLVPTEVDEVGCDSGQGVQHFKRVGVYEAH